MRLNLFGAGRGAERKAGLAPVLKGELTAPRNDPEDRKARPKVRGSARTFALIGYAVIFFGLVVTGTVAGYANIASAVYAPGVVAVESSRKSVQHLEGGIVKAILVKEAQKVDAGQLLIKLDPTQAVSTATLYRSQLFALLGTQGRLEAEQIESTSIGFPQYLAASVNSSEAKRVMTDEERVFMQGRASLINQEQILHNRIGELQEKIVGSQTQQSALDTQIKSLEDQKEGLSTLATNGNYSKNNVRDYERQIASLQGQLGATMADMAQSRSSIEEMKLQIDKLHQDYRKQAADRLPDLLSQISDVREKLTVADNVVARLEITAPETGVVQNLKVHTIGGVVAAGDTILEIVPTNDDLVINAEVPTTSIDSVHAEMSAEVQFPAFRSRKLPIILGSIVTVSADANTEQNTGRTFYLAKVHVDPSSIPVEFRGKLQPGMPAQVVITTGDRTVLDFLVQPLADALSQGMRQE